MLLWQWTISVGPCEGLTMKSLYRPLPLLARESFNFSCLRSPNLYIFWKLMIIAIQSMMVNTYPWSPWSPTSSWSPWSVVTLVSGHLGFPGHPGPLVTLVNLVSLTNLVALVTLITLITLLHPYYTLLQPCHTPLTNCYSPITPCYTTGTPCCTPTTHCYTPITLWYTPFTPCYTPVTSCYSPVTPIDTLLHPHYTVVQTVTPTLHQNTINCVILGSGIGGSGDLRRKWESERGRYHYILLLFAKWSKRTIEMQEVYIYIASQKACYTPITPCLEMWHGLFL